MYYLRWSVLVLGSCLFLSAQAVAQEKPVVLNTVTVRDLVFTQFLNGKAGTILMPEGWLMTGGVTSDWENYYLRSLQMRINDPQSLRQVEFFYERPFIWGPNGPRNQGQLYLGQEIQPPQFDPAAFVQFYVLPRCRPGFTMRVVTAQQLPEVARALGAKVSGRVRVEYMLGNQAVEEDFYVNLDGFTAQNVAYWGTKGVFAIRSARGQLDADSGLLLTIANSVRPDLQWSADYEQALAIRNQIVMNASNAALLRSRIQSMAHAQISDTIMRSYNARQAVLDQCNLQFSNYIRGVEQYRSPDSTNVLTLPSGYNYVWGNTLGQYILTNNDSVRPPNYRLLTPVRQ